MVSIYRIAFPFYKTGCVELFKRSLLAKQNGLSRLSVVARISHSVEPCSSQAILHNGTAEL
ncbi:uncharacterized protein LOC135430346 isoform X2 [Drosophila montana]|uniref:uncharacterized protein LOC135430346 isoform X2 n=1 Tax=Drosophila montana TaxID=40370 RepID=UPI00313DEDD5